MASSSSFSLFSFQFTTSRGGRPLETFGFVTYNIFQFTTSRGGRRCRALPGSDCYRLSIHDLTRRSTCPGFESPMLHLSFNSRPHEEVDKSIERDTGMHVAFNSRPHEEVDCMLRLRLISLTAFQFTTSRGGRLTFSHNQTNH